jgi:hypothetical protein
VEPIPFPKADFRGNPSHLGLQHPTSANLKEGCGSSEKLNVEKGRVPNRLLNFELSFEHSLMRRKI